MCGTVIILRSGGGKFLRVEENLLILLTSTAPQMVPGVCVRLRVMLKVIIINVGESNLD